MESNQDATKSVSKILSEEIKTRKTVPYGENEAFMTLATARDELQEVEFVKTIKMSTVHRSKDISCSFVLAKSCDLIYGFSYPYKFSSIKVRFDHHPSPSGLASSSCKVYNLHIDPVEDTDGTYKYMFVEPMPILSVTYVQTSFEFTIPVENNVLYPLRVYGSFVGCNIRGSFIQSIVTWNVCDDLIFTINDGMVITGDMKDVTLSPVFEEEIAKGKFVNVYCSNGGMSVPVREGHEARKFRVDGVSKEFILTLPVDLQFEELLTYKEFLTTISK